MSKFVQSQPWLDKLMVSMERKRNRPRRHLPLKQQLALNRGNAIGLPRRYPSTWLMNRVRDRQEAKSMKLIAASGLPF